MSGANGKPPRVAQTREPGWAPLAREFGEQCRRRMKQGYHEYGDRSFSADQLTLISEQQQELVDSANWAMIRWCRLEQERVELERRQCEPPRVEPVEV